ncbi:DUF2184 domain-containing protein [Hafnia alvei]|nr:major capsid family protein [Hafnia alvei]MBI0275416.1 DUF2184 domain-containing protein [Hafnia alvei]PNK98590.1 hypothetical protein CEQ28_013845 [Hafnia alvei]
MPRIVKLADGSDFELNDAMLAIQNSASVTMSDDDAVFMQRQLEFIEQQSYDVLYPDLEARDCFGVDATGGAGVTALTYRSYDHVGKAQVINARATDLPKSSVSGKEYTLTVKSVGTSYDFDIDEMAAASVTGLPLEARKIMAATRGYEQYVNSTVWYGDGSTGIKGFFQNTEVTKATVAAGESGKTTWMDKTPAEILADLNTACSNMYESTLKIMKPDEVWLPVGLWSYIAATPRSDNSDMTILQYFVKNSPFIKDKSKVRNLNAIVGQGTGGSDCLIVVCRQAQGNNTTRIREPLPLEWLPVQLHGLVYEVPGRGRFAGLQIMYPAAVSINSGI